MKQSALLPDNDGPRGVLQICPQILVHMANLTMEIRESRSSFCSKKTWFGFRILMLGFMEDTWGCIFKCWFSGKLREFSSCVDDNPTSRNGWMNGWMMMAVQTFIYFSTLSMFFHKDMMIRWNISTFMHLSRKLRAGTSTPKMEL